MKSIKILALIAVVAAAVGMSACASKSSPEPTTSSNMSSSTMGYSK